MATVKSLGAVVGYAAHVIHEQADTHQGAHHMVMRTVPVFVNLTKSNAGARTRAHMRIRARVIHDTSLRLGQADIRRTTGIDESSTKSGLLDKAQLTNVDTGRRRAPLECQDRRKEG